MSKLPRRTYLYFTAQSINLTTAVMSVTMSAIVSYCRLCIGAYNHVVHSALWLPVSFRDAGYLSGFQVNEHNR